MIYGITIRRVFDSERDQRISLARGLSEVDRYVRDMFRSAVPMVAGYTGLPVAMVFEARVERVLGGAIVHVVAEYRGVREEFVIRTLDHRITGARLTPELDAWILAHVAQDDQPVSSESTSQN